MADYVMAMTWAGVKCLYCN